MIFCVLLTGCNTANAGDGSSQAELHSTAASQENTEMEQQSGGEAMSAYTYQMQEIWVQNGDMSIYYARLHKL